MAQVEETGMKSEPILLNIICILAAIGLVVFAVTKAIFSGDFLTTDNLFMTAVCLVLALMFGINPLLYLKSEGKLPIPFKRTITEQGKQIAGSTGPVSQPGAGTTATPLLDAKGRAVPPDVRAMVARMKETRQEDV
jgi:hypothetical protein